MKRLFLILTIFMLSAGMAFGASPVVTETATSTTTSAAYAIGIAQRLAKPILTTMVITATDPLADVLILDGNGTQTLTSAASLAAATSVGVSSCTGLNEATSVVISNSNGDTSEVVTVTSCTASSLKGSITNAFRTGARVSEIDTLWTYSDVGAGTQTVQRNLVGYVGGPMVGKITAATGTATIDVTVDYR